MVTTSTALVHLAGHQKTRLYHSSSGCVHKLMQIPNMIVHHATLDTPDSCNEQNQQKRQSNADSVSPNRGALSKPLADWMDLGGMLSRLALSRGPAHCPVSVFEVLVGHQQHGQHGPPQAYLHPHLHMPVNAAAALPSPHLTVPAMSSLSLTSLISAPPLQDSHISFVWCPADPCLSIV